MGVRRAMVSSPSARAALLVLGILAIAHATSEQDVAIQDLDDGSARERSIEQEVRMGAPDMDGFDINSDDQADRIDEALSTSWHDDGSAQKRAAIRADDRAMRSELRRIAGDEEDSDSTEDVGASMGAGRRRLAERVNKNKNKLESAVKKKEKVIKQHKKAHEEKAKAAEKSMKERIKEAKAKKREEKAKKKRAEQKLKIEKERAKKKEKSDKMKKKVRDEKAKKTKEKSTKLKERLDKAARRRKEHEAKRVAREKKDKKRGEER